MQNNLIDCFSIKLVVIIACRFRIQIGLNSSRNKKRANLTQYTNAIHKLQGQPEIC